MPGGVPQSFGWFSVYVADEACGRRVGGALLAAFLPACEAAGLWEVFSRIFPENAASRALCARHRFRDGGRVRKATAAGRHLA